MKKTKTPKDTHWRFDAMSAMIGIVLIIILVAMVMAAAAILQLVVNFGISTAKGESLDEVSLMAEVELLMEDEEATEEVIPGTEARIEINEIEDEAGEAAEEDEELEPFVMVVTGNHVRMRAEPNTECRVTGHKDTGDKVVVVQIVDGWAELIDGNYMSAEFLAESLDEEDLAKDPEIPDDVLEYANSYSDIAVTKISAQRTWYFRNHELVVTGPNTTGRNGHKTPTSDIPYTVTQKRYDFDMGGDPKHHVKHAIFFNGNIAYHDADWEPAKGFGDPKYRKNHGSAGCVRCNSDDDLIELLWQYSKVGKTRVAVIP